MSDYVKHTYSVVEIDLIFPISPHFFPVYQNLAVLNDAPTMHNILIAWALTVQNIYDSNYGLYKNEKIDKRKPVWKMLQSLRITHSDVFATLRREKIFPGGVLGR